MSDTFQQLSFHGIAAQALGLGRGQGGDQHRLVRAACEVLHHAGGRQGARTGHAELDQGGQRGGVGIPIARLWKIDLSGQLRLGEEAFSEAPEQ